MRALWKMTVVEAKLFAREPAAVFFTLAFPTLIVLLFSAIFGNDPVPGMPGARVLDASTPGYTTMVIGTAGLLGLPTTLAGYRRRGILRRLRATPLRPANILVSQVLVYLLMTAVGVTVMVLVAALVYGLRLPAAPLALAAGLVFASLGIFALGFVLAGLLPSERTANIVGQVVYFPMLFLSGAILPREMFPDPLKTVSDFIPLTYAVDLIRDLWLSGTWNLPALAALGAVLVVSTVISSLTFRWE